jgi:hypothetical protein
MPGTQAGHRQDIAGIFWSAASPESEDRTPEVVVRHSLASIAAFEAGSVKGRKTGKPTTLMELVADMGIEENLIYASPELARGEPFDERSLVFTLGVLIFERLTDRHPFGTPDNPERVARIRRYEMGSGVNFFPSVPKELRSILMRAMGPFPEERYRSLLELKQDLARFGGVALPKPAGEKRPKFFDAPTVVAPPILDFSTGEDELTPVEPAASGAALQSVPTLEVPPRREPHEPARPVFTPRDTIPGQGAPPPATAPSARAASARPRSSELKPAPALAPARPAAQAASPESEFSDDELTRPGAPAFTAPPARPSSTHAAVSRPPTGPAHAIVAAGQVVIGAAAKEPAAKEAAAKQEPAAKAPAVKPEAAKEPTAKPEAAKEPAPKPEPTAKPEAAKELPPSKPVAAPPPAPVPRAVTPAEAALNRLSTNELFGGLSPERSASHQLPIDLTDKVPHLPAPSAPPVAGSARIGPQPARFAPLLYAVVGALVATGAFLLITHLRGGKGSEPRGAIARKEPGKTAPTVTPKGEPQPKADPTPDPKEAPEPKPEPKAEPKPEPKAEPKPEPKAEPKPEPKVAPKPEPKTAPRPATGEAPELAAGRQVGEAIRPCGVGAHGARSLRVAAVVQPGGKVVRTLANTKQGITDRQVVCIRKAVAPLSLSMPSWSEAGFIEWSLRIFDDRVEVQVAGPPELKAKFKK